MLKQTVRTLTFLLILNTSYTSAYTRTIQQPDGTVVTKEYNLKKAGVCLFLAAESLFCADGILHHKANDVSAIGCCMCALGVIANAAGAYYVGSQIVTTSTEQSKLKG